jgi:hypothetical protein
MEVEEELQVRHSSRLLDESLDELAGVSLHPSLLGYEHRRGIDAYAHED